MYAHCCCSLMFCFILLTPETRCLPMVFSSFSHYSVFHMVANMYVLWTFSTSIVSLLGREQFLAVYLSAGTNSPLLGSQCRGCDASALLSYVYEQSGCVGDRGFVCQSSLLLGRLLF